MKEVQKLQEILRKKIFVPKLAKYRSKMIQCQCGVGAYGQYHHTGYTAIQQVALPGIFILLNRVDMGLRLDRLNETRNHQHVANVGFDVMWHEHLAEVHNRHTATVDQKLLKVPANVVRLQVVIRQTIFLSEIHGRRRTVSLQVQWK